MSTSPFEAMVSIPSINAVKEFVAVATQHSCRTTLTSDRYTVDAKSIMGVFSLDTSKPILVTAEIGDNGIDDRKAFMDAIANFIAH